MRKKRDPFLSVGEIVYRRQLTSGSIIGARECIVGRVPVHAWKRIMGRRMKWPQRTYRSRPRVWLKTGIDEFYVI